METIFDKIVRGEIKSRKVWEDDKYLAFLTPFASMPGQIIVIPKLNIGGYVFNLSDEEIMGLVKAAKIVAKKLEKAFGVEKVAMVFEGLEVAYVHAKLYPLSGRLTTVEGPQASDDQLDAWQKQIVDAGK